MTKNPPIIIVGMHRSGTTLLVRFLERTGSVFMGADQTVNGESRFFQDINRLTLDMFGCSWRALEFLPSTDELCQHFSGRVNSIARMVAKDLVPKYRSGNAFRLPISAGHSWGWKDPRNSLLLPIWQRVFSDAKIVHIVRNGRDVAQSLLRRAVYDAGDNAYSQDALCRLFISDFRLWETYVQRIDQALPLFNDHLTIKYEQLLQSPLEVLHELTRFLGIPLERPQESVVSVVDRARPSKHDNQFAWAKEVVLDSESLHQFDYAN